MATTTTTPLSVVFGSDHAFLPYTAVALHSLLKHYRDARQLHVYLLVDQPLDSADRAKFDELKKTHDFTLIVIPVQASAFESVRTSPGISIATYYRLYMHLLLPVEVNRALWLDGDLIVCRCVSELFDTELGDALFAGVEDSHSVLYRKRFNMPLDSTNINCGVLVANLAAMRSMDFLGEVSAFVERHRYTIMLGDQQIINVLFSERLIYVPVTWNVHGNLLDDRLNSRTLNDHCHSDVKRALRRPGILHYCGTEKPWHPGAKGGRQTEWRQCALSSPYRSYFSAIDDTARKRSKKLHGPLTTALLNLRKRLLDFPKRRLQALLKKGRPLKPASHVEASRNRVVLQTALSLHGRNTALGPFSARAFINALPTRSSVALCGNSEDLDGGFHENLKWVFRTPNITKSITPTNADFSLFLLQNIAHQRYWDCLSTTSIGRQLIFAEASFFGAYSGYFDRTSSWSERKCFGYLLDDMGYFFDAGQPSRMEATLNDAAFALSPTELERSRLLIERIKAERITKYNKYAGGSAHALEPDSIIVVDQRPQDASILFGAATSRSFGEMIAAAVRENQGRTVYLKRHPDNVHNAELSRAHFGVTVLPDDFDITSALDGCHAVYTVTSQVGFEALLRGKRVVTFGVPFYAGWGLTEDRCRIARRTQRRTVEELFHTACIKLSVYIDPETHQLIEIEDAFDVIARMRKRTRDRTS